MRRAVEVAVFAPLGLIATLAARIAHRSEVPGTTASDAAPIAEPGAVHSPAPEVSELPIEGYDFLAASQVIDRLDALTLAELKLVGAYERAHRRRQIVLGKIAQLSA